MSLACLVFLRRRLFLLPIITAAWIIASFFISYAVALNSGTVEPFFPYISYTAIDAPERCIFGQLINIGALLLGMNVWIRYLYLKEIFQLKKVPSSIRWQRINIAGITLGILSALGISMVANFQTVVLRIPHYFGAGLAFILGTAYIWIQTLLSWKLRTSNLRGFYLTSTITEWLVATSVLTFTLTFTKDFRAIELESPRVKVNFDKIEVCSILLAFYFCSSEEHFFCDFFFLNLFFPEALF
ncbi:hypothetical protein FSP39_016024 [Pinctada imbricata]|uniref:CWH43-like N-terminal domain-containing protein n=1 Tax=Pinctada imbricata TaxID=66713 RepID=A0AA88YJU7_PINIB|nr:hypothetical protein FSP39_016024 [Pinctada imbricata]